MIETYLRGTGLERLHGPTENLKLALGKLGAFDRSASGRGLDGVRHGYGIGARDVSE